MRGDLTSGAPISGPALIAEPQTTTFVVANYTAAIDGAGNIVLTRDGGAN